MKKTNTAPKGSTPAVENPAISKEMLALHEASYQQMTQLLEICSRKIDTYSTNAEAFESLKIRELQCLVKVTLQLQGGLSNFISERETSILQRDSNLKTAIETGKAMPKSPLSTIQDTPREGAPYSPFETAVPITEAVGNFHQWESGKKPKQNLLSQRLSNSSVIENSQSPF